MASLLTLQQISWQTASIALTLLALGAYCVYQLFLHPLARFPGPPIAALTNLWKAYHVYRLDLHEALIDLHDGYGPLVRVGPNHIHLQAPEAAAALYKGGRVFPKTEFYSAFQTFNHNLFGTQDEDAHAIRRRQLAHGFSQKSVSEMEYILDAQLEIFCDRLSGFARSGESFDLKECIASYVLEILGEIAFSYSFQAQVPGASASKTVGSAIDAHILMACAIGELPCQWLSKKLLAWSPIRWMRVLVEQRQLLKNTCEVCVRARIENGLGRKDLLRSLITAKDPETGARLTEVEVNTEAFALLLVMHPSLDTFHTANRSSVAGSHTTSGTLSLFFANVLRRSDILTKLQEELDAVLGAPVSPKKTHSIEGLEDSLPYLMACVRENFRMNSVFTMPLWRRVASQEGFEVRGNLIPQHVSIPPPSVIPHQRFRVDDQPLKTNVSASNYVQHHDKDFWGPDHDQYDPTRWQDHRALGKERDVLAFSIGHRVCIGRNLAMTNILKTLTTVLTRFDLQLVNEQMQPPVRLRSSGIGGMDGPLVCTVSERNR